MLAVLASERWYRSDKLHRDSVQDFSFEMGQFVSDHPLLSGRRDMLYHVQEINSYDSCMKLFSKDVGLESSLQS